MTQRTTQSSTTTLARTLTTLFVSAGALVVGLTACGHSDDKPPIPAEAFAKEFAAAHCDNIGPCCKTEGFPFEQATCRANAEAELQRIMTQTLIDGVVYDAVEGRECVNAYAELARSCTNPTTGGDTCSKVFRGTKETGEACTTLYQCVSRSCEASDAGGMTCAPARSTAVHAKKGDPCNTTCRSDDRGTSCSSSAGPGAPTMPQGSCYTNDGVHCSAAFVCETIPELGQACTVGSPCVGDAFCDGGTCKPKRTTGDCTTIEACVSTSYCHFTTRQCQPKGALGEPCSTSAPDGCLSPGHCSMGICRRITIADEDTCAGDF